MAMQPTTEQLLLQQVAEVAAYQKANHAEQQRTNNRVADELARLATVNEQRERAQQDREGLLQQQINTAVQWQLTHPRDPGAHPDLHTLVASNSEFVNDHESRLKVLEDEKKAAKERSAGRREVWGLQYKALTIGAGTGATILGLAAAGVAWIAGVFS